MAVTERAVSVLRLPLLALLLASAASQAAVLPADRADVMYHSYDGGGVKIDGPAVLVRKSVSEDVSLNAQYYVDQITGASIDVQVNASEYREERTQYDIGMDYLLNKAILTLGFSNSTENDYDADTYSVGISQDFFGDLSTLSMSYSYGADTVGMSTDARFEEDIRRHSYQFSWTQVMTRNLLMNFTYHVITDQGFLNNPYRSFRALNDPNDPSAGYTWYSENFKYPETRTSHATAIRGKYYMPYRAAFSLEYRRFNDTWKVKGYNIDFGYIQPLDNRWTLDAHYRYYSQGDASFYSDLFPIADYQNYMARDKELSTFTNSTIGIKLSYELDTAWANDWLDKSSVSLGWDIISFDYDNFRDARRDDLLPGHEPRYSFDANVIRLFVSGWF